jgi:hypothetical protein
MSTTSKVMYSMRGFFGVMNDTGKADPDWFNSFSAEAIEGLRRFFELFSVKNHFFEGCEEKDFVLASIVNEDFGDIPSVDVDSDDHGVGVGK